VLYGVQEKNSVLHTIKLRTVKWIGQIFRRNGLLKHVIEGKLEGTGRWAEGVSSYWTTLRKREDTGT
jgi:hypothetical protein